MEKSTEVERDLLERYFVLGLRVNKHVDGFVDAYYGPPQYKDFVDQEPRMVAKRLALSAKSLLSDLESADSILGSRRANWLRAQVRGVLTSCEQLDGVEIAYEDFVERCYGVRPQLVDESLFEEAHARLQDALPGTGLIGERLIAWRESTVVPSEVLLKIIDQLTQDLRKKTLDLFGLPVGEQVNFELVTNKPWSGFNYYMGDFKSYVAINIDLPVLGSSLAHLIAHEAYPGHHTEHSRKEAGLVRKRKHLEESMFLVNTPHCLVSEGLADLALEIVWPDSRQQRLAEYLIPHGVNYQPDVHDQVIKASESMARVRDNAAMLLHRGELSQADAAEYIAKWALLPKNRAAKSVEFITDKTWWAYSFCYTEGLRLCRSYVGDDPMRFQDLISEQLTTSDLVEAGT